MANRKKSKKYYFSVEGQTECWYLLRLKDLINSTKESVFNVDIDCQVKEPLKRVKGLLTTSKTEIYHFSDYESEEDRHVKLFKDTMDQMKKAMGLESQAFFV